MRVDIWSDIVCPWCYIGKREFEQGLAAFAHGPDIEVVYHAFELDPTLPPGPGQPVLDLLSAKYGLSAEQARDAEAGVASRAEAAGLPFSASRLTGSTFDAHRLVALARDQGRQPEVLQRLYEAYFAEGLPIFDAASLTALGASAGLDPAQTAEVLAGDNYADQVRADEQQASALGISGVPFFVIDGRYGVSGAQPPASFTKALNHAWARHSG